jgi:succinate dehydrogenase / fumarate reductase flavoprotein subunit
MLHTLYQRNVRAKTNFFVEWLALDLIRDDEGDVVGVTALEMETGQVYILGSQDCDVGYRWCRSYLGCIY